MHLSRRRLLKALGVVPFLGAAVLVEPVSGGVTSTEVRCASERYMSAEQRFLQQFSREVAAAYHRSLMEIPRTA